MYAEVVVNAPVDGTFHYHIPDKLAGRIRPGHLVEVPFGKTRQQAVVLRLDPNSPVLQTKPIHKLLDAEPVVQPVHIALAEWMSQATLSSLADCLRLFLPPGLSKRGDIEVTLCYPLPEAPANTTAQKRVIALLERRGPALRGRQIARALPHIDWQRAVGQLARRQVVASEPVLDAPSVKPRTVRTARLAITPARAPGVARMLGRESKRANVLEVLVASRDPAPALADVCDAAECAEGVVKALHNLGMVNLLRETKPARVSLALPPDAVVPAIIELRGGARQYAVLQLLAEAGDAVNVSWIYEQTGAKLGDLKALAEDGLIVLGEDEIIRDPLADYDYAPAEAPVLTPDQQGIWAEVRAALDSLRAGGAGAPRPILLHGVTGSGKTEIYLRAVEAVVRQGRQAVVLVPEISLTPQTVRRFLARFPRRVGVVHSHLGAGVRYDTWRQARAGRLDVIVGARSALFVPLPRLGLIVLDEAHDDSYKQSPPVLPPFYHARDAAVELGRLCGAAVILGTATPDVVDFYRAQRGEYRLLTLPQRVLGHRERVRRQAGRFGVAAEVQAYRPDEAEGAPDAVYAKMPPVQIVDMRQELRAGNRSMFSRALRQALEAVLSAGQQAILFMNRRGTSTSVMCRDCGYVHVCPQCDTPLVYHGPDRALTCHHCGHHEAQPHTCPACGSKRIKYLGVGTELIEQAVTATLPGARVLRWDRDTTGARQNAHEAILQHFIDGNADILVGTQMIAKGLDLPLVTLVGVVLADVGLNLPDYRAAERTFQVLAQVAGRAGRGLLGGRVILQTYNPEHIAVAAAAHHDYHAFYAQEIVARRDLGYPPFMRLARLLFRHPQAARAEQMATEAAALIREQIHAHDLRTTHLIGPVPCFFTRLAGQYRWHVVIRSPDPLYVLEGLPLKPEWTVDIDPVELL
ncbi:MAG: primosomal protein N' [Anaerolineae bacterium]|nr:primosomal protein N' [Anaerolineae bacterium]